jgi:hypothetical protein
MNYNNTQQNSEADTKENNPNNLDAVKSSILGKIMAGEVKMRSKKYFTIRLIVLIVVAILVLLISSLLVSFIVFSISVSGRSALLGFGWKGIGTFLLTFPWVWLAIDAILLIVLDNLLNRFKFGYRLPLMYLLLINIALSVGVGVIIDQTRLHRDLEMDAGHGQLPFFNGMYTHVRRPPHEEGVFRGTVLQVSNDSFTIVDADPDIDPNATSTATSTPPITVLMPPSTDVQIIVHVGEEVIVAGDVNGNTIRAFGIQEIATSTDDDQ